MQPKEIQQIKKDLSFQNLFVDVETKRKIDEHLSDINHQITDADLLNAKSDNSLFQIKNDTKQRVRFV
ncbi:MAG: hypothetical protein WAT19_06530 [Ferruginibacter sp.]